MSSVGGAKRISMPFRFQARKHNRGGEKFREETDNADLKEALHQSQDSFTGASAMSGTIMKKEEASSEGGTSSLCDS